MGSDFPPLSAAYPHPARCRRFHWSVKYAGLDQAVHLRGWVLQSLLNVFSAAGQHELAVVLQDDGAVAAGSKLQVCDALEVYQAARANVSLTLERGWPVRHARD